MKDPSTHHSKQHDARPTKLPPRPIPVVLYTRAGCHLCDDAKVVLAKYQSRFSLEISEIDIDRDPTLKDKYGDCVPVVVIQGRERFRGRVNPVLLLRTLHSLQ